MSAPTGTNGPSDIRDLAAPGELPDDVFDVARQVYAGDEHWIPEDEVAVRQRFSAANPWFERGRAHVWSAPGQARLAAFLSPETTVDGLPSAYFGFWETLAPDAVDAELFARAESWARSQGARRIYGPIDFTTFSRYRLVTGGDAELRPFHQEPYNPADYPARLERLGYRPTAKSYATMLVTPELSEKLAEEFRPSVERMRALGYQIENFRLETWMDELPAFHRLCDEVFSEQFGYTSISYDEFAAVCGESYARRVAPDLSFVARDPEGEIVGILINTPDWSPLLAQGNPDRLRPSEIDHDTHRPLLGAHRPLNALVRTGGLLPGHRNNGLAPAGLGLIFEQLAVGDWDMAAVGVVTVGNAIHWLLSHYDTPMRTYALYEKDLV